MNKVELLNKEINILKNNIQEIIDNENVDNENVIINTKKEKYLLELDNAVKSLNKIKKSENEIKKVQRLNDNISFNILKKKANSNELMNEIKHNREIAKENFEKLENIQKDYIELELKYGLSDSYPGYLFFHKDIINCIKDKNDVLKDKNDLIKVNENTKEKRVEYINNFCKEKYNSIFNQLIKEVDYNILIENKNKIIKEINDIQTNIFDDKQKELYNETLNFIQEFIDCKIKTKKIKDKFKLIINNVSILNVQTCLNIHDYLNSYYHIQIHVNDLKTKYSSKRIQNN